MYTDRTTTQRFKSKLLSSSGEMPEEESSLLLKRHVVVLSVYTVTMGKVQIPVGDVSLVTLLLDNYAVHLCVLSKYTLFRCEPNYEMFTEVVIKAACSLIL